MTDNGFINLADGVIERARLDYMIGSSHDEDVIEKWLKSDYGAMFLGICNDISPETVITAWKELKYGPKKHN